MGYGQLSEHTMPLAVDVAAGRAPMPERVEDQFYAASEQFRVTYWEDPARPAPASQGPSGPGCATSGGRRVGSRVIRLAVSARGQPLIAVATCP